MSMQGVNQQNLSTFIQKTAEKPAQEKQEKTEQTGTGGAQERDDGVKQNESDQGHEVTNTAKTEQAKTEKTESTKEKFMEKVSQEEVKTTHKTLSETVSKTMESQDVKPDKLEKQSFTEIKKGLDKIKDPKSEEPVQPKLLGQKIGGEGEAREPAGLIGQQGAGGAKDRDDNEMQAKSDKVIEHEHQEKGSLQEHHEERDAQHRQIDHVHSHHVQLQAEHEVVAHEKKSKQSEEDAAKMHVVTQDETVIKSAAKSDTGGGMDQGSGGAKDRDDNEMQAKSDKVLTEHHDEHVQEHQHHEQREVHHQKVHHAHHQHAEIHAQHEMELKEEATKKALEANAHLLAMSEDEQLIKASSESQGGSMENNSGGTDKKDEKTEKLKGKAKDSSNDSSSERTEVKSAPEFLAEFVQLINKMPESQMSQGDKQQAISEMGNFVNSPDFSGLSHDVQRDILSFIDGTGAQKGIYQKLESMDLGSSKKLELTGPLTGVTMNTEMSLSKGGTIKKVNEASIKVSNDIDASLKIVTQTKPTGETQLVSDQLFGSSVEINVSGKTTPEQFKSSMEATVNKLLTAFTDHSGSSIDRGTLKAALESAFNKAAQQLEVLPRGQDSVIPLRIQLTQDQTGAIQAGKLLLELEKPLLGLTD